MPTLPSSRPALAVLARAAWWGVIDRRDTAAHVFIHGNEFSCCSRVEASQASPAPTGRRGCRPCAVSIGLTDSVAEAVST
jgi:hypothetical protein